MKPAAPEFTLAIDPAHPPAKLARAVYAIGNFDGVHLGHQAVIRRTLALAAARGVPAAVLTFEPHPADYFAGRPVVFRITPFAAKAEAVEALGVNGMAVLSFDASLANLSAEAFISDVLVRTLGIGAAVIGGDFHFGKSRSGSPAFLAEAGARHGFAVDIVAKVEAPDLAAPVSSTEIRRRLESGDVEGAAALMGRRYAVTACVIKGQQLGRTLDTPTANMALEPTNRLAYGIYAVRAHFGGRAHGGVASWGVRPTVDNGAPRLETFIFDFSGDLYGRDVKIEFVGRIREERKFDSLEALKLAIADDIARARAILAAEFGVSPQIL